VRLELSPALAQVFLLHRDVKPSNILLSSSYDVKLGDFGLSKLLSDSRGVAETQVGTPLYMSPELCEGKPYDRGADVWAFGCTLYETMRLQEPWSHLVLPETGNLQGGLMGLLRHIRTSTLDLSPLRSRYSERLVGFVGSLLEKKRKRRLEKLSEHLERLVVPERPKPPASWGLSAAAEAALSAMNAQDEAEAHAEVAAAFASGILRSLEDTSPRTLAQGSRHRSMRPASPHGSGPPSHPSSRHSSRPGSPYASPRPLAARPTSPPTLYAPRLPGRTSPTCCTATPQSITPSSSPAAHTPTSLTPTSTPRCHTPTHERDAVGALGVAGGGHASAVTAVRSSKHYSQEVCARGAEVHAAAGVLQRSIRQRSLRRLQASALGSPAQRMEPATSIASAAGATSPLSSHSPASSDASGPRCAGVAQPVPVLAKSLRGKAVEVKSAAGRPQGVARRSLASGSALMGGGHPRARLHGKTDVDGDKKPHALVVAASEKRLTPRGRGRANSPRQRSPTPRRAYEVRPSR